MDKADVLDSAARVLAFLNARSSAPLSEDELERQLRTIRDRPVADGIRDVPAADGLPSYYLGTNVVYAKTLGLASLSVEGNELCVDVLNHRGELGLSDSWSRSVVEVLVLRASRNDSLFRTLGQMVEELEPDFCFVGAAAGMTGAFLQRSESAGVDLHPREFLWPLSFFRGTTGEIRTPCWRLTQFGSFVGLQVEDDLFAGHPERDAPIAQEIGVRSLWDERG